MRAVVGMIGLRYTDRPMFRDERRFAEVDEAKVLICVQCGDAYRRPWRESWCCSECRVEWKVARAAEAEAERNARRWSPRSCASCASPLPLGTTAVYCS